MLAWSSCSATATPSLRTVIDRLAHLRTDSDWVNQAWRAVDSKALVVASERAAVLHEASSTARLAWRPTSVVPPGERYLLGRDDGGGTRFAVRVDEISTDIPSASLRSLAAQLAEPDLSLALHAVGLANWHATHTHCPRCGSPTAVAAAGAERRCPRDGSAHFPRTDPAVIVLVVDPAGRALLGHHRDWPAGRYSTLAGFVEPGESAEDALIREVAEESGLTISDISYVASQAWPFPASLMLGFHARASGSTPVPDGVELADVRWFDHDEFERSVSAGDLVPPSGISIAHSLVKQWFGAPLPPSPPGVTWR